MDPALFPVTQSTYFRPTVYKQRWFILIILSWLNFTNALLWISYASISDHVSKFYDVSLDSVNYLSLAYPVVTIILSLPAIWGIDKVGLRMTCISCGWINLISSLLRMASSDMYIPVKYRFPIAMIGQVIGAIAQPLAMFSPAKLASVWFPPNQRAIATTIAAMGNPFGILLGSVLPPYFINISLLNISIALMVIAFIGALLPTLGIYRSSPPVAPALSSDRLLQGYSFFGQLRICCRNYSFLLLSLAFGVGLGLFTVLSTLFEQILCPYGYTDEFSGTCGALLIGAGIFGSIVSGIAADKTKAFAEIVQFCFVGATFGIIAFSVLATFPSFDPAIGISVAWIGTFGVALYSVALELAAEISFPVSENVSTGLLVVSGQLFSVLFIVVSQYLRIPLNTNAFAQCTSAINTGRQDYWPLNVFLSSIATVVCTIMLFGFKAQYRRSLMETALFTTQDTYETDVEVSLSR